MRRHSEFRYRSGSGASGYSTRMFVDEVAGELLQAGVPAISITNTQFMGKTPAQKLNAWLRQRDTNPTPAELAL